MKAILLLLLFTAAHSKTQSWTAEYWSDSFQVMPYKAIELFGEFVNLNFK